MRSTASRKVAANQYKEPAPVTRRHDLSQQRVDDRQHAPSRAAHQKHMARFQLSEVMAPQMGVETNRIVDNRIDTRRP